MPLGVQPPRTQKTWGYSLSAILGMVVFVTYYGFVSVAIGLAQADRVPAIIGLWIPNIICLLAALYALQQTSSERWQSIAHGLEELFDALKKQVVRRWAST